MRDPRDVQRPRRLETSESERRPVEPLGHAGGEGLLNGRFGNRGNDWGSAGSNAGAIAAAAQHDTQGGQCKSPAAASLTG